MAERESLTVDWDKYLDQSDKLVKMAQKLTFTQADNKILVLENNKLKRELNELEGKYVAAVSASRAMKELYDERTKEFIDAQERIDNCKKWMKAMKKEAAIHGRA